MKNILILTLLSLNIAYAQNNYVSLNDNISDLSVLDSAIKNHNVFFLGENHTYRKTNTFIEFKTLKYLNQKEEVRILLLEFGEATSWLVNKYFETGDEEMLDKIKNSTNNSFSDFFKKIYDYNQTIESNKIITAGIDIEFNYNIALNVLERLIPENKNAHDSISETIEVIKFINGYINTLKIEEEDEDEELSFYRRTPDYYTKTTLSKIIVNFEKNPQAYKALLDTNFITFKNIIEGAKQAIRWQQEKQEKTPYAKVLRENYMYKKFVEVFEKHKKDKFFGQFGRAHTAKEKQEEWSGLYNFSTIAARINQDNRFSVFSIGIYYPHYFEAFTYSYQIGNKKNEYKGMSIVKDKFEEIPKDSILLYTIQEEDTFFLNKFDYLIVVNKGMKNEDYFTDDDSEDNINYTGFEYSYGFQEMDLQQYNEFFFNSSSFKFTTPLVTHKIESYSFENHGFYSGYHFLWYQQNKTALNDSTELTLGGYKFGVNLGGDIIKHKNIHLIPQVGFSFMQLKTKVIQKEIVSSQFFTTETFDIEKTTNPAFIIDLKTTLKFTLFNFLALGVEGGYQLDLSSDSWKYNKKDVKGLRTKLDGYFLMFSAGFSFE